MHHERACRAAALGRPPDVGAGVGSRPEGSRGDALTPARPGSGPHDRPCRCRRPRGAHPLRASGDRRVVWQEGMRPLTAMGPPGPGERRHRGRGPTVNVVSRLHRRRLATLGLAGARPSESTVAVTGRFVLPHLGPGQGVCRSIAELQLGAPRAGTAAPRGDRSGFAVRPSELRAPPPGGRPVSFSCRCTVRLGLRRRPAEASGAGLPLPGWARRRRIPARCRYVRPSPGAARGGQTQRTEQGHWCA